LLEAMTLQSIDKDLEEFLGVGPEQIYISIAFKTESIFSLAFSPLEFIALSLVRKVSLLSFPCPTSLQQDTEVKIGCQGKKEMLLNNSWKLS
jgi:hypothetical protein